MTMISSTLKNLKFMKNEKNKKVAVKEKTLSYYACKCIVQTFQNKKAKASDPVPRAEYQH